MKKLSARVQEINWRTVPEMRKTRIIIYVQNGETKEVAATAERYDRSRKQLRHPQCDSSCGSGSEQSICGAVGWQVDSFIIRNVADNKPKDVCLEVLAKYQKCATFPLSNGIKSTNICSLFGTSTPISLLKQSSNASRRFTSFGRLKQNCY